MNNKEKIKHFEKELEQSKKHLKEAYDRYMNGDTNSVDTMVVYANACKNKEFALLALRW